MKPQEFRKERVVACEVRYQVSEEGRRETHAASGTLSAGRVVWVQEDQAQKEAMSVVAAYAEGIGIVSLDPQCFSF